LKQFSEQFQTPQKRDFAAVFGKNAANFSLLSAKFCSSFQNGYRRTRKFGPF